VENGEQYSGVTILLQLSSFATEQTGVLENLSCRGSYQIC